MHWRGVMKSPNKLQRRARAYLRCIYSSAACFVKCTATRLAVLLDGMPEREQRSCCSFAMQLCVLLVVSTDCVCSCVNVECNHACDGQHTELQLCVQQCSERLLISASHWSVEPVHDTSGAACCPHALSMVSARSAPRIAMATQGKQASVINKHEWPAGGPWTSTPRACLARTPTAGHAGDVAAAGNDEPSSAFAHQHGCDNAQQRPQSTADANLPAAPPPIRTHRQPPEKHSVARLPETTSSLSEKNQPQLCKHHSSKQRSARAPKFVIARGGIAFSISPPSVRNGGHSAGNLFVSGGKSPRAALLRLRKLRRNAHFRKLTCAPAAAVSAATSLPPASAALALASERCPSAKQTLAEQLAWYHATQQRSMRRAARRPCSKLHAAPKFLRTESSPASSPQSTRSLHMTRQWHDMATPSVYASSLKSSAPQASSPRRLRAALRALPWRQASAGSMHQPRVREPPASKRAGAQAPAAPQPAQVPARPKHQSKLAQAVTGIAGCSLAVVGQAKEIQQRPSGAQPRRGPCAAGVLYETGTSS